VGEAIRLQIEHVQLDREPSQLHILETKFHKSRIVPLHPSTAERLRHYREQRARLHYDALSDAFFISEQGLRIPRIPATQSMGRLVLGHFGYWWRIPHGYGRAEH
jgi:integrase